MSSSSSPVAGFGVVLTSSVASLGTGPTVPCSTLFRELVLVPVSVVREGVPVVLSANNLQLQADLQTVSLCLVRGNDLQPTNLLWNNLFRREAYIRHLSPHFREFVMCDSWWKIRLFYIATSRRLLNELRCFPFRAAIGGDLSYFLFRESIHRLSSSRWNLTAVPGPDARSRPALTALQIVVRLTLQ